MSPLSQTELPQAYANANAKQAHWIIVAIVLLGTARSSGATGGGAGVLQGGRGVVQYAQSLASGSPPSWSALGSRFLGGRHSGVGGRVPWWGGRLVVGAQLGGLAQGRLQDGGPQHDRKVGG